LLVKAAAGRTEGGDAAADDAVIPA
jgi:hypothetical protein